MIIRNTKRTTHCRMRMLARKAVVVLVSPHRLQHSQENRGGLRSWAIKNYHHHHLQNSWWNFSVVEGESSFEPLFTWVVVSLGYGMVISDKIFFYHFVIHRVLGQYSSAQGIKFTFQKNPKSKEIRCPLVRRKEKSNVWVIESTWTPPCRWRLFWAMTAMIQALISPFRASFTYVCQFVHPGSHHREK